MSKFNRRPIDEINLAIGLLLFTYIIYFGYEVMFFDIRSTKA